MKISVFGLGYVGLANALLLDRCHEVTAYDINHERVEMLKQRQSPLVDQLIEETLQTAQVNFVGQIEASMDFDYAVIATPTNYDEETQFFDTSSIENVIDAIFANRQDDQFTIIIKPTVPIGYVDSLREKYQYQKIIFSPEFLREGHALEDNLHPARLIVGDKTNEGELVGELFHQCILTDAPVLLMGTKEAESVKLFANTYLAMRVAFMNELDTFASEKNLDSKKIIQGIGLDPRIGLYYNNPSFGYGGYCLPKDTKQLLANYQGVPQKMMTAIVESNEVRKQYIVDKVLQQQPQSIGVYRLIMKAGSDNFRKASMIDIIEQLKQHDLPIVIYEPDLEECSVDKLRITHQLTDLEATDLILANRLDDELAGMQDKVFTRDLFHNN